MIKLTQLLKQERIEYQYIATHDGEYWFPLSGKWYISPKKAEAALKASNYNIDLTKFKEVKIIKSICKTELYA